MGKIELEALRKRARSVGLDPGTLARAHRAKIRSEEAYRAFKIAHPDTYQASGQMGLREPPAPRLVDPKPIPMEEVRRWVVAVCKPSMARGVSEDLNDLGFVAYCPLNRKVHLRARARVGRRKMIRQYPVFGAYIFVGEVDEPLHASIHDGITEIIGRSLRPSVIKAFKQLVLEINQAELDGKWDETGTPTWAKTFKAGDKVKTLAGFEGLVTAIEEAGIKVDLKMFGGEVSTTLKPSALEML